MIVSEGRATVAPDRLRVSTTRLWAMTVLTGAMVWAALSSLQPAGGRLSSGTMAQASGVVAVLAVFGLRSVPVRWIIRGLALLSGVMLARFGQLGMTEGLSGSWRVLVWLGSFAAALTFAPSSRSVPTAGSARGSSADPTVAMSIASDVRGRIPAAIAIAAVSLVAGAALLLGPRASNWFPTGSRASDLIDRGRNDTDNVLVSRDTLDMTARPRLSDKVVMTVRSPIVAFWRAELFDTWNGRAWTRSYAREGNLLTDGRITPSADDIAAQRGNETTQEFRLQSGFATVMPAAASPIRVSSANEVAQRADGTLVSAFQALGSGTTYSVTGRQMNLSVDGLRAAGSARTAAAGDPVAERVLRQYATSPATTDRVIALARKETAGAKNDFDRIVALESWMSHNTTYSLDAPLSPRGVDVVDHFLFEEPEGWCEQIASSLVVLARSVGIPARLATGYAPGEWDSTAGRFVVRERDAHAWAEVWFAGQGWVPFDPTATVPLSGTPESTAGAAARDWREILGMVLVLVGLMSVGASPLARMMARVAAGLRRRREERMAASARWEVRAARRLERIGMESGHPRAPSDSLSAYGASMAEETGDRRFAEVGRILDRVAFSDPGDSHGGTQGGSHGGTHGGTYGGGTVGVLVGADSRDRRTVEGLLDELEGVRTEPHSN